jgi:hypothetical protein
MMGGMHAENDYRWQEGHSVKVRYPLQEPRMPADIHDAEVLARMKADRAAWPWLGGEITVQRGPDEWLVNVYDRRVATLEDGSHAPEDTPDDDVCFPVCSRDSSEISEPETAAEVPETEAGQ